MCLIMWHTDSFKLIMIYLLHDPGHIISILGKWFLDTSKQWNQSHIVWYRFFHMCVQHNTDYDTSRSEQNIISNDNLLITIWLRNTWWLEEFVFAYEQILCPKNNGSWIVCFFYCYQRSDILSSRIIWNVCSGEIFWFNNDFSVDDILTMHVAWWNSHLQKQIYTHHWTFLISSKFTIHMRNSMIGIFHHESFWRKKWSCNDNENSKRKVKTGNYRINYRYHFKTMVIFEIHIDLNDLARSSMSRISSTLFHGVHVSHEFVPSSMFR